MRMFHVYLIKRQANRNSLNTTSVLSKIKNIYLSQTCKIIRWVIGNRHHFEFVFARLPSANCDNWPQLNLLGAYLMHPSVVAGLTNGCLR
jgi:hypothetical protein